MGNSSSKSNSSSANVSPTFAAHEPKDRDKDIPTRRPPRRRGSLQVLTTTALSKTAAPPSASFESARGLSSHSQSRASRSRPRSQSSLSAGLHQLHDSTDDMGNQASSEKAVEPDRARLRSPLRTHSPVPTAVQTPSSGGSAESQLSSPKAAETVSPTRAGYYLPNHSQLARPPRLPLPIEEEVLSPGSPIFSPADLPGPVIEHDDLGGGPKRANSVLSSTTVDDDDIGDNMGFESTGPTKDNIIEWKAGGNKVYTTGTFTNWSRKYRLHENGPSSDPKALSATIPLPLGTHHIKFIVDGNMTTSNDMPTAVDYTNVLVNYIEIGLDDIPPIDPPPLMDDVAVVDKALPPQQPSATPSSKSSPQPSTAQSPGESNTEETQPPPKPDLKPAPSPSLPKDSEPAALTPAAPSHVNLQEQERPQKESVFVPSKKFFTDIPRFLQDLDAPEDSTRFARASSLQTTQPNPPSLPMFLNKSILNGTTPMKDDSSVLNLPNHTVLNHLATSSIKNDVLATSATTRYKRKYVTTIMYNPTKDPED